MFPRNTAAGFGSRPNPVQFQSGDNSSSFAVMRAQYQNNTTTPTPLKKKSFNQLPYSLYLAQRKSIPVGQSSTNGLITYKAFDKNVTKSALQRIRSSSCVAPAKKGSIHY